MNLYKHQGSGHYIGSTVILFADSDGEAKERIRAYLDSCGLKEEEINLESFDIKNTGAFVFAADGDY